MKNILQQKFDDFEDEPDRDVWVAIETTLHPKQAGLFSYRKYMWAAAASVAMLLGIGYFSIYSSKKNPTEVVQNEAKIPKKERILPPQNVAQPQEIVVETPVQTVAQEHISPTKATQSVKKIKTADGRTLIEKTETYIVTEKKIYEVEPKTKKEVQVGQSMEKQSVQVPTIVSPSEIRPVATTQVAEAQDTKSEPWKVYNLPAENTTKQAAKVVAVAKHKGQNTQLDLNHTNPVQLASFASQQLNKVANTPVTVNYKEDKKTNKVMYEIGFKDFKIVRKTKK